MAFKSFYASADDVPEALREHYSEAADGRFVADIEDIDGHPKVSGVIRANKENARKAQERLAKIEELEGRVSALPEDFDAEEWGRLKAGAKPDEALQALKDQHSRAIEALKAKSKADTDVLTAQIGERDGYIDGQVRREALNSALDEVGFDPIHKALLVDHLGPKIKVRHEDGGRRVAFADTDLGEIATLEFVKDFAGKQGKAYLAKASGPGAAGGARPNNLVTPKGDLGGSKEDRRAALSARFPELGG